MFANFESSIVRVLNFTQVSPLNFALTSVNLPWKPLFDPYASINHYSVTTKIWAPKIERDVSTDRNTAHSNWVITNFSREGRINDARKVFDEMPQRDVVTWTTVVSGYIKCGMMREARELFDRVDCRKNVVTWTAMVSGYSKIKDLTKARAVFDEIEDKSVVSWNAMLSGYAQNGFVQEGLSLFNEMVKSGVQPDETTWVTVISSCSSSADVSLVGSLLKSLHENRHRIRLNAFVKTALIDLYAKIGSLGIARKIFDELGGSRNSVTWNAMISAYMRVGDLNSARELFDSMPQRDVVSWNSMISGYAQNGQSFMAIELFKEMIKSKNHPKPDEVTMVSVISACGHLGALGLGAWAANFIAENHIELGVSGHNSLIFMYSKSGSMKDAIRIFFHEMRERDVISYNTLISGFAAHGNGIEAVKLMSKMKEEGIKPDRITYISVLTACSHGGLLEEGSKVFQSIDNPSVDHYACMVDLLGRVGKLDEAMRLIERMPMEPHAGVYGSLLNASRIHKKVELGEFIANKLFELEPHNSGNYVLLSNIYALAGKWEKVERIREMMREKGVKKTTGFSWVEFQGKMHKFIVGDRSHERSNDIYRILRELGKKMKGLGYVADKSCVLRDVEEEEKEEMVGTHSEKLAIGFGLLVSEGEVIRVVKNLRVCLDCHSAIKMISKLEGREIIVRDNNRFHSFRDGLCSCNDHW